MNLRRIISALRIRWWLLAVFPLVSGMLGFAIASGQEPLYASRARLMVGQDTAELQPGAQAPAANERLINTYAELIISYPVLAEVIEQLQLQSTPAALAEQLQPQPVPATNLLDIIAMAGSPEQAAAIANAVAGQLILQNPSGIRSFEGHVLQDVRIQIDELKTQIEAKSAELAALQQEIEQTSDRNRRQALEEQRDRLQARVDSWQHTLAELYAAYLRNSTKVVTLVEQAQPDPRPVAPHPWRAAILGALLGLALAPGIVRLTERRYLTIRRPADISAAITGPLLGVIPRLSVLADTRALSGIDTEPHPIAADSYESLRINLQMLSSRDPLRLLAVTGPGRGEGKTTVAVQLALAMARVGMRVILIDANVRRPRLHRLFHINNSSGLTTMLTDAEDGDDQRHGIVSISPGLSVIPSGPALPNLRELLAGERMELLLWILQQEADIVILDAPLEDDILALLRHGVNVLLIAAYERTRRAALRAAYRRLQKAGVQVLGVAINRVSPKAYHSLYDAQATHSRRWRRMLDRRRRLRRDPYAALIARRQSLMRIPINIILIAGCSMLLYGGGLYADAAYEQQAARGDNELQPAAVELLLPTDPEAFVVPVLNQSSGESTPTASAGSSTGRSTLTRLIIPRIGVDTKVIEVNNEVVESGGRLVRVWQVAKYAVGHHKGSANPGEGSNIVLAGHVGGVAPVFKDLIMLEPGDQLMLVSAGRQYLYTVSEKVIVQEIGVSDEVRLANARYMAPTPAEMVTMITCWPPAGPDRYHFRVIVRAVPYGADGSTSEPEQSNWEIR
ncbi:MAG: hypothetical protein KatS3mg057_1281 [Herpetosiphonaceae bacterium]|nr:MAG: hypothetical protein KatS3mg057_1281 [Herpetosiphonaceae bacterium]